MISLKTLYRSTYPIDSHILKGRLETELLTCYIYDENLISVHPFYSLLVGRIKLKVPEDQIKRGKEILKYMQQGKLTDQVGEYEITTALIHESDRQNKILELKSKIRSNPSLLDSPESLKVDWLSTTEIEDLITFERKFQDWADTEFKFSWHQFWYELFDFDRNVFLYLRPRPVDYYLEKDLVDNYMNKTKSDEKYSCPNCNSGNVSYGYTIDGKWDILFLSVSFLILFFFGIFTPSPFIRKNCHCYDCGHNFKRKKS